MSDRQKDDHSPHVNGETQQLIGFIIGKFLFGADIKSVHEILRTTFLTEMPNAPDYVEGLMNLRGNIFPLISLKKKFSLDEEGILPSGDTSIVVIEIDGMLTGIRVDKVTRVFEIDPQNIKNADLEESMDIDPLYCSGIYQDDDRKIILPDFERILMLNDGETHDHE